MGDNFIYFSFLLSYLLKVYSCSTTFLIFSLFIHSTLLHLCSYSVECNYRDTEKQCKTKHKFEQQYTPRLACFKLSHHFPLGTVFRCENVFHLNQNLQKTKMLLSASTSQQSSSKNSQRVNKIAMKSFWKSCLSEAILNCMSGHL